MTTSPTARSLKVLRELGYTCAIVEKFVRFPPPGHRVDLFGFIDILAIKPGHTTLAVQTTSASNAAARIAKIKAHPNFPIVADAFSVICHAWRKGGPRGERKTWSLTETEVMP